MILSLSWQHCIKRLAFEFDCPFAGWILFGLSVRRGFLEYGWSGMKWSKEEKKKWERWMSGKERKKGEISTIVAIFIGPGDKLTAKQVAMVWACVAKRRQ